uniref:Uncharacterized protein n=1 Tax=Romanomermis culicivorax TaxID=13658 RepID=A0A915HQV9_ROMCU
MFYIESHFNNLSSTRLHMDNQNRAFRCSANLLMKLIAKELDQTIQNSQNHAVLGGKIIFRCCILLFHNYLLENALLGQKKGEYNCFDSCKARNSGGLDN